MFGNFLSACTNAKPSRWVKEILPPRVRLSWLLITVRLSIISLAGMARTLVAVGRSSDWDMFLTTAAAAPRSTCTSSPSPGVGPVGLGGVAGALVTPLPTAAGAGGAACAGEGPGTASAAAAAGVGPAVVEPSPVGSGL